MARRPAQPRTRDINLLALFDDLNLRFFNGMVYGGVGWRNASVGEKQSTLAICYMSERYIRMNAMLRDVRFPLWYVRYILYHEMLHIYLGPQQFEPDGTSYPHNERFRLLEHKYPEYQRAMRFELSPKYQTICQDWQRWQKYQREQRAAKRNRLK